MDINLKDSKCYPIKLDKFNIFVTRYILHESSIFTCY